MKKIILGTLMGLVPFKAFANPACVVCTVAIGASLSIARTLGVDDCVVGVWTGAMLAIIGYWTMRFCDKRGWQWPYRDAMLMIFSISMIGFMYVSSLTYSPIIIGFLYLDPFLFTNLVGAGMWIASMHFYDWMKMKNGGHAHFPFEKVVVPVFITFLISLLFHYYPICDCAMDTVPVL